MVMDPTARSDAVLAEDVDAVADQLDALGAAESVATLCEAARPLDPEGREDPAGESLARLNNNCPGMSC